MESMQDMIQTSLEMVEEEVSIALMTKDSLVFLIQLMKVITVALITHIKDCHSCPTSHRKIKEITLKN
jgi:hypothetical protein